MSANRWRTIAIQVFWAALFYAFMAFMTEWRFAAIIVAAIWVHEMGHLLTARALGIATKGVYFIPMLGAVAPMMPPTTRRDGALVAIMGPAAGGALAIAMMAAAFAWENPVLAGVAGLVAMFNLFNMIPVAPLDGGRVATAVLGSISPKAEIAFGFACLAASVLGIIYVSPIIFAFVGWMGYLELRMSQRRNRRDEDRDRIVAALAAQHATQATTEAVTAALRRYLSWVEATDAATLWAEFERTNPKAFAVAVLKGRTAEDAKDLYRSFPALAAMDARKARMPLLGGAPFLVTADEELAVAPADDPPLLRFLNEQRLTPMRLPGIVLTSLCYLLLAFLLLQVTGIGLTVLSPGDTIRFFMAR